MTERKHESDRRRFTTIDMALMGVMVALWVSLNLTLGRVGFQLLNLPILCDVAVFLTLLLSVWLIGKLGTATIVGAVGSLIALLLTGSPHNLGLAAAAIIFDLLLLTANHKINSSPKNLLVVSVATLISAASAGTIIGLLWPPPNATIEYALFWGGWHAVGGFLSLLVTLPALGALEKANVQRLLHAR